MVLARLPRAEWIAWDFQPNRRANPEQVAFVINTMGSIFTSQIRKLSKVDVLSGSNDSIVIQVKDSGMGVQDDKLDAIFEPFVRASSDRSGAGLGLAIARQAVHANRGTIRALNRVEGGLLIEIRLPYGASGQTESAMR
jgi:signal transduction histidine kinase